MSVGRHTAYNLTGALVPLVLSLVTIPVYIGLIGEARYGVLAVAFLLLGYFGLFDLGLGTATAQRVAAMGEDASERASTFWTALAINLGVGVVGGLLIWPVAVYFFRYMFNVDPALRIELDSAIPWLALALPLATVSGVLTGALQGRSKFLELNFVSVLTSGLTQIVPLAVAWVWGANLALLLPAVVFTRVIAICILFTLCREHVFKGWPRHYSRALARSLLGFGGWVTVSSLVGPMMTMLDRFAIGATLGARAVTHYTVPFQLVEKTSVLPAALTSAIFPRLASGTADQRRSLSLTSIKVLLAITTPLLILGMFVIGPFLAWWLTPEFAGYAATPARILLLGFGINAVARVPYVSLLAAQRPAVIAKCQLAELLPYLLGLYLALKYWGLPGAAVVFGIRTALDCFLLLHFAGIFREGVRVLLVPAVLLTTAFAVVSFLEPRGEMLLAVTSAGTLMGGAWVWRNCPTDLRTMLSTRARCIWASFGKARP